MKRLFDIFFSLIGLVVVSPIFMLLALLIKLESHGPIFFFQTRVGLNNKDFKLFKFRSMYVNAESKGQLTVGAKDPRITKVGYFIRKYKLDELPQLLNVLIGNMSLVGPRPEVRKYVSLYNPEQLKVLTVKPGITDKASILFINENELLAQAENPEEYYIKEIMPAKININLIYIAKPTLLADVGIILQTIRKILT